MSSRKSVLIIGPCLTMGGMEKASITFTNEIFRLGHAASYLALFKRDHFFILDNGIKLYEPEASLNRKSLSIWKTLLWIRRIVGQINPDSILVFNKFYGAIVALALYRTKYSYYISERSSPFYKWSTPIRIFNRVVFTLHPPKGIVSQTLIAMSYQKKYYPFRTMFRVIYNALSEVRKMDLPKKNQILAVGRLNDHLKGFDRLIIACSKVDLQNWKIVFAGGDIKDNPELYELIVKHKLQEHVEFLGRVKDMSTVYSESSMFVIPSRSEGFPNALAEAMAYGLPCLSFNFIAGPSDLISHNINGILIEDGNVNSLAEAIELLINNPELRQRLGNEAQKIKTRLSSDVVVKDLCDFMLS